MDSFTTGVALVATVLIGIVVIGALDYWYFMRPAGGEDGDAR